MTDQGSWDGDGRERPSPRARWARSALGFGAVVFLAAGIWLENTPDMFEDLPRWVVWACSLAGALGQAVAALYLGPDSPLGRRAVDPARPVWREGLGNNLLQPVAHFVGYAAEQERMHALFRRFPQEGWRGVLRPSFLRGHPGDHAPPLVIVVTGLPATGKSQLANRVARQVGDRFPDGVRWMDLSRTLGADEGGDAPAAAGADRPDDGRRMRWLPLGGRRRPAAGEPAADAAAADAPRLGPVVPRSPTNLLEEALDAVGDTPRGPRRQLQDAWRTLTAGKRILLVLENAEDPRQVEALCPNSAMSAVLVTSRRAFQDASFEFESVTIDGLTGDEGIELLEHLAPVGPAVGDPERERDLRREIVEHCHGLPLAVAMCGKRLASSSGPDTGGLLEALRHEDETPLLGPRGFPASFTVVFQMSGPTARLLLRRMAATGMGEIADYAAAALLGVDRAVARRVIEELQSLFLIEPVGRADDGVLRFRLHELVGDTLRVLRPADFAVPEEEGRAWGEEATHAARKRLVDAYTWMVERVAEGIHPADDGFPQPALAAPPRGPRIDALLGLEPPERPQEWLDRESEVVLGCIWMAAADGHAGTAWRLSRAVAAICLVVRTHWDEWDQAVDAQLAIALEQKDLLALGMALLDAAELCASRGGYVPGDTYAQRAAYVFEELGADARWTARARRARAVSRQRWGDLDGAMAELRRAESAFAEHGEPWWHARTLYNLAEVHFDLGRLDVARDLLERAAASFSAEGDTTQRDLSRILLAEVLAAGGRELRAWYMLREMRDRFAGEGRHWYVAQCLRVMGELDGDALERHYQACDLVFNGRRQAELRDRVEREYAHDLRERERAGTPPGGLSEHMALRRSHRERLERSAADHLGEYAAGAHEEFTRAAGGGRRRARARRRAWSVQGRTALLRQAIGLMERMGDEWGMRRAQLTLGRTLVRARDLAEGREQLRQAAEGFARLHVTGDRPGEPGDKRWAARAHHIAAEELFTAVIPGGPEGRDGTGRGPRPPGVRSASTEWARKQMKAAREHAEQARAAYGERENHSGRIGTEILMARILWAVGAENEAVFAHLESAESDAREHARPELAAEAGEWREAFANEHAQVARGWVIY
ncbi:NB-ARC domain-containing protein [Nocardiopsis sediminis]|uniref:NB-ARC domain-containing protein n=1 Tax=Nocardiopsis sediminis TaxID=1778267 RepID=A0ABV8FIQ1_9ACTN